MVEYNYNITDTANDTVLSKALDFEIRTSTLSTQALTDFDGVRVDDDTDIVILFDSSLSSGDETTLDAIIAAHPGTPIPYYEEYEYTTLNRVSRIILWENSLKETKIKEVLLTHKHEKIIESITIYYDGDGTESSRLIEEISSSIITHITKTRIES
jgi:hypothetical protein